MNYEGNLEITKENENDFKNLVSVNGAVSVYREATLDAPKLETVGGYVYVSGEAKLPKLETVGGYVSVSGEAKLDAPKLETVGGYVSVSGEAKLPKLEDKNTNNQLAKLTCEVRLNFSLAFKGFALFDGILSWVLSEKRKQDLTIYKVKIVGKLTTSFVVQRGNTYSHGETIQKAIEDLRYKISDRDKSEFEYWKKDLNQTVSIDEAIAAYRVVTGACEYGVREFVKSIEVPEKLTPLVVVGLTKGRFGNKEFEAFLKGECVMGDL